MYRRERMNVKKIKAKILQTPALLQSCVMMERMRAVANGNFLISSSKGQIFRIIAQSIGHFKIKIAQLSKASSRINKQFYIQYYFELRSNEVKEIFLQRSISRVYSSLKFLYNLDIFFYLLKIYLYPALAVNQEQQQDGKKIEKFLKTLDIPFKKRTLTACRTVFRKQNLQILMYEFSEYYWPETHLSYVQTQKKKSGKKKSTNCAMHRHAKENSDLTVSTF